MMWFQKKKDKVSYSAATDAGVVREINQDNFYFMNGVYSCEELQHFENSGIVELPALFAICDGMGGGTNGEKASKMIVDCLATISLSRLQELSDAQLEEYFKHLCLKMNDRLFQEYGRMDLVGSTMTLLFLDEKRVFLLNVGDSPCFCKSEDMEDWKLMTLADNCASLMQRLGMIQQDEVWTHKTKNELVQYIGMNPDEVQISPHIYIAQRPTKDTRYLLCSDGLFEHGEYEKMMDFIRNDENDCDAITCVNMAKNIGSRDNISVIVVKVGGTNDKR